MSSPLYYSFKLYTIFIGSAFWNCITYTAFPYFFSFLCLDYIIKYGVDGRYITSNENSWSSIFIFKGNNDSQSSHCYLKCIYYLLFPSIWLCTIKLFYLTSALNPLSHTTKMNVFTTSLTITWWNKRIFYCLTVHQTKSTYCLIVRNIRCIYFKPILLLFSILTFKISPPAWFTKLSLSFVSNIIYSILPNFIMSPGSILYP